ncbi:MAG: hypothetical protein QOJ34_2897 [Pseudonocardiales bacterium]|nr:hypothetical protein [Pseudonocardiales bacterium]
MRAADLLIGPRGRDLCWSLTAAGAEFTENGALAALADATTMAVYWQEPIEHHLARPGVSLEPVAERLAAGDVTTGWAAPIALDDQHVVDLDIAGHPARTPDPAALRGQLAALTAEHTRAIPSRDDADRNIDWRTTSGVWWSAPSTHPGVHTTRSVGGRPLGLLLVEDDPSADTARSWRIRAPRTARVLELGAPADWVELVGRYPLDVTAGKRGDWWRATGRDGGWLMPDWPAVAGDWDAVHLSIAGYLTTAGRALDVDGGYATVLAGWDPDATFWFDDVIGVAGDVTRWSRDADLLGWTQVG